MQYPILLTARPGEAPAIHIGAGSAAELVAILADLQHHGFAQLVQPDRPAAATPQPSSSAKVRTIRQRAEAQPMPEEPPSCPDHRGEMGWSQWEYWYCPSRDEAGEWCRWRWDSQGLRQPTPKRAASGRRGA